MTIVWLKAASFNEERGSVASWIFTISRNKSIDRARANRPLEPLEATDELICTEPTPEDACLRHDVNQFAMSLCAMLPIRQQNAIEWCVLAEETHTVAASKSGLPLGTLKSDVRKGLLRLRQIAMAHGESTQHKRANVSCAAAD